MVLQHAIGKISQANRGLVQKGATGVEIKSKAGGWALRGLNALVLINETTGILRPESP